MYKLNGSDQPANFLLVEIRWLLSPSLSIRNWWIGTWHLLSVPLGVEEFLGRGLGLPLTHWNAWGFEVGAGNLPCSSTPPPLAPLVTGLTLTGPFL